MTEPQVSLTIYNEGTALVRDRRIIELREGFNALDFTDVAAAIDATSVTFQAMDAPETVVLEQNYLFDLVGRDALLRRYLEQPLEATMEDGTRFSGTLLNAPAPNFRNPFANSALSDIILRQDDGQIALLAADKVRDMRFLALPGGLITRPTLRWLLHSAKAGPQPVVITYLTGGINWTADYNLLLAAGNSAFDLNGWVTLTNTSGTSFADAQVKLVAGQVQRIQPQRQMERGVFYAAARLAPEPQVEQRELFEYQLYEIKRPVTVAQNETKQVEFITAKGVQAETFYVFQPESPYTVYDQQPVFDRSVQASEGRVMTWLEFSTGDASGLGADLPAGRMRVYQLDTDGAAALIGEDWVKHTPKNEHVRLPLGKAFDLVGERAQIRFQQARKNIVEESYRIILRNRKDAQTVQIRVRERLFRWSNWEIIEHSHPFTVESASDIEFRVDVPASGRTVVTYTVRYEWAE